MMILDYARIDIIDYYINSTSITNDVQLINTKNKPVGKSKVGYGVKDSTQNTPLTPSFGIPIFPASKPIFSFNKQA
jgi:hypothetical protein